MSNSNMQVNIVMHSFNAIEARAKKAAQMRQEYKNEYAHDTDPVAHYIYEKAFEQEKQTIEEELLYRSKQTLESQP